MLQIVPSGDNSYSSFEPQKGNKPILRDASGKAIDGDKFFKDLSTDDVPAAEILASQTIERLKETERYVNLLRKALDSGDLYEDIHFYIVVLRRLEASIPRDLEQRFEELEKKHSIALLEQALASGNYEDADFARDVAQRLEASIPIKLEQEFENLKEKHFLVLFDKALIDRDYEKASDARYVLLRLDAFPEALEGKFQELKELQKTE